LLINFHHRDAEFAEFIYFFFLCALSASALKIVADPSCGGSAVNDSPLVWHFVLFGHLDLFRVSDFQVADLFTLLIS
jgi:hypothetical protein